MNLQIVRMRKEYKAIIKQMMKTFYSSEAVLTNGSDEIFENDIKACVSDCVYAEGYVFKDGSEYLGYAMIAKSFSTEFGKPCIWIEDLYIEPLFRGKGIGKEFFKMIFKKYPDVIFRLEAEKENQGALKLYQKCGFDIIPYLEMIKNK